MNIPEEFGKYLLLKKLREDPLGETFRAGRVGKDGIEQVVLLRVLNGPGLDGEKLWNRVSGRGPVQQALRSPNIGSGVDLGRVRSYPYVAYDYVSGKDLATLFSQAARLHSPIPADHALLVAERIALALAAAYETRVQDERVLHGFVVPQLVMISNEGESRLLGFEIAPGLRELAAGGFGNPELRPYLAPEAATAPLGRADDVYSLGAILFELLTGQRLPAATADGYAALIDAAELPNEGTPLPPAVAALLKKSLVPREQRIPDAVTWHKTISKLMIDGHFSSTTFNLAFFMHNLFRDEIERESQEIQAEKTLELPRRPAAAQSAPAAAPQALRDSTGVRDVTLAGAAAPPPQAAAGSRKGLWAAVAAAAVAALLAGGYFAFVRSSAKPAATTAAAGSLPPGAQPVPPAGPGQAPAAAGPTPEQLKAQIDQMVAASGKEMEAKLKQQYDERIKQLQQQLEESRKTTPDARRTERPAPPPAQVEPAAPVPVETHPATRTEPAAPPPQPAAPAPGTAAPASSTAAGTTAAPAVPPPATAAPPPAAPPAPARQPQVQFGDLVQPGPGVTLPKMTGQPDPRYPAVARRFNRAAQVSLKVLVDERGHVIEADRVGEKAGFGFDEAALEAARHAFFQPATKDGVRVKMWTSMRVTFKP